VPRKGCYKALEGDAARKLACKLLETPFWPDGIDTRTRYFRTHDDCDGEMHKGISVLFSEDGDSWVRTCPDGCRFRTYGGGGMSLRVRNAMLLLALAIKMDNEERPQQPPQEDKDVH